jgi:hypothetical protein
MRMVNIHALRNNARQRNRMILMATAVVLVLWLGLRRGRTNVPDDETGFVAANADNQEDFATSARSAINTALLADNSDFGAPPFDASKPILMLIVGPVKTGVQALAEKELSQLQKELDSDKYKVLPPMEGLYEACHKELAMLRETHLMKKKTSSLEDAIAKLPCWKTTVLDVLAPYQTSRTSVIIVDETLSKQFLTATPLGPAVLDWMTLRETIMPNWNVVVVLSYRRYYEWLPSAKAAAEKVHLIRHAGAPRLAKWPGEDEHGMLLEPLFPHFIKDNAVTEKLDVPYTPRLQQLYTPFVQKVQILNFYVPNQSVRTTMVCNVLGKATAACAASRAKDQAQVVNPANNTLSLDSRSALWDIKADEEWFNFQLYDELAVTAASHGYIRTKFVSRPTATKTTQYYVETYLNIKPRVDLPLACPHSKALDHFLDQSLQYERLLVPDFVAEHKAGASEREHRLGFGQVGKGFCSISMNRILRQVDWRTFFRHLTETSAVRIQAGGKPGPVRVANPSGGARRRQ